MPQDQVPLDPALRDYLDEQAANAPQVSEMSDTERVRAVRASMPRALEARDGIPGLPNRVSTRDLTVAGRPARLYQPQGNGSKAPMPLLVYLHGGGWVGGNLGTHDPFCCLLSEAADILILSVDYRQPPEHRFPAALEDTVAAIQWAADHAAEIGADPDALAVGGDSAGGNLTAAAVNRLAAAQGGRQLRAQVLLFPATDAPGAHSYEENGTGYGLTAEAMRWFWNQYAPEIHGSDPDAFPLRRDPLPVLPPTLVVTAGYDVLRDEGIGYAEKLRSAGVAVTHLHTPEMHHNFPVHPGTVMRFPQSVKALDQMGGWLRATLGRPMLASLDSNKH